MIKKKLVKKSYGFKRVTIYEEPEIFGIDADIAELLEPLFDKLLLAIKIYGIKHPLVKKAYAMKYNISDLRKVRTHYSNNSELQKILGGKDGSK
jgi:hypothetical protein